MKSSNESCPKTSAVPEWMAEAGVPGVFFAIIETGKPVRTEVYGVVSRETGQPVTPHTLFHASSLTKPLFAYAVLKLCEDQVLDLDAPLTRYLPKSYLLDEPLLEPITARRVLSHTSGLPNVRGQDGQPDEEPLRIEFTPGERFGYSGEGYLYLQRVVEYITGQALEEFMASRLIMPLGMSNSSLIRREGYEERTAQGHDYDAAALPPRKPTEAHAAYSLVTTPADYALFVRAVLWPPEPNDTFLRSETVQEMLTPHIPLVDARLAWGLGWGLVVDEAESFWHWGQNESSVCFVAASSARQTAIVVMTNGARGGKVYERMIASVMGGQYPPFDWLNTKSPRW